MFTLHSATSNNKYEADNPNYFPKYQEKYYHIREYINVALNEKQIYKRH